MRHVVLSALLATWLGPSLHGGTVPSAGAAVQARPSACALLTKEVVTRTTPYPAQQLTLVLAVEPMEDPIGAAGSACSYGGVTLQVDPFAWATIENAARKGKWTAVTGVGDAAFFHDNRGRYAELAVRAGRRVLTIQMDVPDGRTSADVQPNTIALAKAVLPAMP